MKLVLRDKMQLLAFWLLRFDDILHYNFSHNTEAGTVLPLRQDSTSRLGSPDRKKSGQDKLIKAASPPSICFGIMILSLWLPARSIRRSKRRGLKEEPTFPSGKERRGKLTAVLVPASYISLWPRRGCCACPFKRPREAIRNAAQGECNDSIKPQSVVVSASGWRIDRAPVRRRRAEEEEEEAGRRGASVKCAAMGGRAHACTRAHTHARLDTIFSLIYSRSALMSSWLQPQLPSADDLAPVLMKEQGNSTEVTE